jgi:hypothetical protein
MFFSFRWKEKVLELLLKEKLTSLSTEKEKNIWKGEVELLKDENNIMKNKIEKLQQELKYQLNSDKEVEKITRKTNQLFSQKKKIIENNYNDFFKIYKEKMNSVFLRLEFLQERIEFLREFVVNSNSTNSYFSLEEK